MAAPVLAIRLSGNCITSASHALHPAGGAGTALVGDPETVAARMKEYMALGIESFILSGYPHLEEAYRFAELVFPLLPLADTTGRGRREVRNEGPFGEMIANDVPPAERARAQS